MTRVTPKHWIQPSGTIFHLCFRWRIRFLNGKLWSCVPGLGAAGKLMSPVPVPFIIWLAWRNHHKTSLFLMYVPSSAMLFSGVRPHTFIFATVQSMNWIRSWIKVYRIWTRKWGWAAPKCKNCKTLDNKWQYEKKRKGLSVLSPLVLKCLKTMGWLARPFDQVDVDNNNRVIKVCLFQRKKGLLWNAVKRYERMEKERWNLET